MNLSEVLRVGPEESRRGFLRRLAGLGIGLTAMRFGGSVSAVEPGQLPDQALTFPGPWQFLLPKGGIIW